MPTATNGRGRAAAARAGAGAPPGLFPPRAGGRARKATAKPAPPKRPAHRPSYKPSEKDRRTVEAMAAGNLPQAEICIVLGISKKTLRKHFPHELATAFIRAKNTMWVSLFNQGLGSREDKIPPNVKATIAWLEFKGGATRGQPPDGGTVLLPFDSASVKPFEAARRIAFALMAGMSEPKVIDVDC